MPESEEINKGKPTPEAEEPKEETNDGVDNSDSATAETADESSEPVSGEGQAEGGSEESDVGQTDERS